MIGWNNNNEQIISGNIYIYIMYRSGKLRISNLAWQIGIGRLVSTKTSLFSGSM